MSTTDRIAGIVGFATLGALTVTQELAARVLESLDGGDADLVAEESLALVCTTTARSAQFGLRDTPESAAAVAATLLELPMAYHDYLIGGAMLEAGATEPDRRFEDVYDRLARKLAFYTAHLPEGRMPGRRLLADKMALWMGRVSPPRMPEMPEQRLERLGLVDVVVRHATLVRAHAERG